MANDSFNFPEPAAADPSSAAIAPPRNAATIPGPAVESPVKKAMSDIASRLDVREEAEDDQAGEDEAVDGEEPVSVTQSDPDKPEVSTPNAPESYLALARRAANEAAASDAKPSAVRQKPKQKHKPPSGGSSRVRIILAACTAPLVLLALASVFVNRNQVTAEPAVETGTEPASDVVALRTDSTDGNAPDANAFSPSAPQANAPAGSAVSSAPPQLLAAAYANPALSQALAAVPVSELEQKAKAGDVTAARDLGLKYLAGDGLAVNESEAARWLMTAAYKGEASAEYWLATLYAGGRGLPADAAQAQHWYEAAAKQGNSQAMHSIAMVKAEGQGTEKNLAEAARLFQNAAEHGLVESQFNLAVLHERGEGVSRSVSEAFKWYAIAAAQGNKDAAARVSALSGALNPADLEAARSAAANFKPVPNGG